MEKRKSAWLNGLFLAATLFVNTMGAFGYINGLDQKQISDRYTTLITPSPFTFSIWSVIYSLLLISVVVMIVKKNDPFYRNAVDGISNLFRLSCILNMAWIVAFSYVQIELSVLFIFGLVITLAMLSTRLRLYHVSSQILLPMTFGLYTGWLFIATVVNVAAALVKIEWDGFGIDAEIWAVITLAVSVVLVFFVLLRIRNVFLPLPVAWAYWGISQSLKSSEGFVGEFFMLRVTAVTGMAVLIIISAIQFYRNRFTLQQENERNFFRR